MRSASRPQRSAFVQLCEYRDVLPDAWRKSLACPLIPVKCLLDCNDDEMEQHYQRVEERAEATKEDRALLTLEEAQDGLLERQARKVFLQEAREVERAPATGSTTRSQVPLETAVPGERSGAPDRIGVQSEQVPDMLERLRFNLTDTEVHYLLRRFNCTDDFDMIPDNVFNLNQWLWVVGETVMLKAFYKHINPEAFEVCYESMIENLKMQRDAGLEGTDEWPHIAPTGPGWFMTGGKKPGYEGPMKPYVWGVQPEIEEELMAQLAKEEEENEAIQLAKENAAGLPSEVE